MAKVILSDFVKGFSQEELYAFASRVGFDGIDYAMRTKELFRPSENANYLSKKYKIPIISVHLPLFLALWTPISVVKKLFSHINKGFKNVKVVNNHLSGIVNPWQKHVPLLVKYKNEAKKHDIVISFENGTYFPLFLYPKLNFDLNIFPKFIKKHNLLITYDVSHAAEMNYDIIKFFKKNQTYIKLIHLSDYNNGKQHLPLGEGKLPLIKLLTEIKKINWNGIIDFEIFHFPNAKTKKDKFQSLKRSLALVRKYT